MYIKYKNFFINDNIIYIEGEPSKKDNDDAFKVITKKIYDITKIILPFSLHQTPPISGVFCL